MKALEVKKLNKTYRSGTCALRDVSISIQDGDFYGLLGPNGAGKSTLIGIITGLVTKSNGNISVFGLDLDHAEKEAKRRIGMVPQEINIHHFEKTLDVLIYAAGYYGVPRSLAKERALKYLRLLSLENKANVPTMSLSAGMKRRLMIARALMHEPKFLILDEPTVGVDVEIRREMWDFLKKINSEGVTILLTTHYLDEAEYLCQNLAIIQGGKIIEDAPKSVLLEKLQKQQFVIDLKTPYQEIACPDYYALKQLDAKTLEVEVLRHQNLNGLFKCFETKNLEVASVRPKVNRLEELFLNLIDGTNTRG
jgi:ABC-2 type transport system ATP-binding protein